MRRRQTGEYPALQAILRLRRSPIHAAAVLGGYESRWWRDPRVMLFDAPLSWIARDPAIEAAGVTVTAVKADMRRLRVDVAPRTRWTPPTGRLYPLADYDAFARRVWERRGRPRFRKQKIDGIRWGAGSVEDNGKRGWDRAIRKRILGCHLQGGRIVITCPD